MIPLSGNITFLFTEIEEVTRLAQIHGEEYSSAIGRQGEIIRESVERANGHIFKSAGGSYCCAFEDCSGAVLAATEAQSRLCSEDWKDIELKVRMGIHTGHAEWNGSDYMGYMTLARANRVMSSAYGNQILISENAHDQLGDKAMKDHEFRNLGERRLKDLIKPLRLYQVLSPLIPSEFPPLKTLDARPNNIPVQLTSFIGRQKEMNEVKEKIQSAKLLTIMGTGGTGKTRLAMQAGAEMIDEFANGVFLVGLSTVSDSSLVARSVLESLGLKESADQSADETIVKHLSDKSLLLLLDNCEHLISACAVLTEKLLKSCSRLKVLATSREALKCEGERVFRLNPLSVPDSRSGATPEKLIHYESVRLFIERALTVNKEFRVNNENAPALSQICFQLDGIPLAIELAAARTKALSLQGICDRLSDRFKLLSGGNRTALPRQQTLKALIDWSYDLLSEKEKTLCRRLTVFSGGWTLETAEYVCSDEMIEESEILDLLELLTDKSLVRVTEQSDSTRYDMLESIKKYCEEKLDDPDEIEKLTDRHFRYYYHLAENSEKNLTGSGQREWIKKLSAEKDNIRECLNRAFRRNPDEATKMSVELGKFWELQSHFKEGLDFLERCLESAGNIEQNRKARAIYWKGFFLVHLGKYPESKGYLIQSMNLFRELNDKDGEALVLLTLGMIAVYENDYENLERFSDESLSLSLELNNRSYIARNLQNIGLGLLQQGMYDSARIKLEESLKTYRELGDTLQTAKIISNIGALDYLMTDYESARKEFEESLMLRRELGDKQGISIALTNLGSVAYMLKDFDEARKYLEESLEILKEIGDKRVFVTPLNTLANVAYDTGEYAKAFGLFYESLLIATEISDKYGIAKDFEGFSNISIAFKNYEMGCRMAAIYISMLRAANRNLVEGELIRMENIKDTLRSALGDAEYERLWMEGENMDPETAMKLLSSDFFRNLQAL